MRSGFTSLRGAVQWVAPAALTALAYLALGLLALTLAIPPSYAAPLYPPAGLALATALVYRNRAWPGIAIGGFCVSLVAGLTRGSAGVDLVVVSMVVGLGAAAQAALGAWLVRRFVSQPLTLREPRDVARFFFWGALVACVVNSGASNLTLALLGIVPPEARWFSLWTWWSGDVLGVLIATPLVLTLIGQPRPDWVTRRMTVGAVLLIATVLLSLATALVADWDRQRNRGIFERDAALMSHQLSAQLNTQLSALTAMHSLFLAAPDTTRAQMQRAAQAWLDAPIGLQAVGFSQRLARADVARFEQQNRAEGVANYRVFDRLEGAAVPTVVDDHVVAIRYIEPMQRNSAALGVNALSIPAAREAIERAARTGTAAATAGFRLTQESDDLTGVVIYQTIERATVRGADAIANLHGVVFITLRIEESVQNLLSRAPAHLRWCLLDPDRNAARRRLAGASGCENDLAGELSLTQSLSVGGRLWEFRMASKVSDLPGATHWNAWLFSVVGLLAAAMLGALMLTVTGRARRIQAAVAERTMALEREARERRLTEVALRESEQRLRNILDHVPIGVVYADLAGMIRETNPRLREMVGYRAGELATMSIAGLTHRDDRADDSEQVQRLIRGELALLRQERRLVHKNGQVQWAQVTLSVLRDADGTAQRLVGVFEDVTEHMQLREAERAREVAEAANRAKSEFVSRMSHELRTPLNAMLGFAQLLELDRKPALNDHQTEWTARIQDAGWHLLRMINDMLDLSRVESGTLKLDLVPLEVAPLVRGSVALIEGNAAKRGIVIEQDLDSAADALYGDETRVKQIVTNLLTNAVKYNVDGGRIRIVVRATDMNTIELRVHDTGLGLSQEQLTELFQPFNRLGRERGSTEGTGIGLVISRRLAELMGGSLRADSTAGEGSTFVLSLPRATFASSGESLPLPDDESASTYRQRLVHYVEDNETNAEVMRGILARRPQVRLQVSINGLDGLAAIRQSPPSLILLDMQLPDVDGLELLRHLKASPDTAGIPVVAVSADATQARIDLAFAEGVIDYVTKPVNVSSFLALMDRLLAEQDTLFG